MQQALRDEEQVAARDDPAEADHHRAYMRFVQLNVERKDVVHVAPRATGIGQLVLRELLPVTGTTGSCQWLEVLRVLLEPSEVRKVAVVLVAEDEADDSASDESHDDKTFQRDRDLQIGHDASRGG